MQLKTQVKVSAISNLHDARFCAGMGVNLLGFQIDPDNERFVAAEKYNELKSWVEGVKFVGEFNDTAKVSLSEYKFDYLQTSTPSAIQELQSYDLPLILEIKFDGVLSNLKALLEEHHTQVNFFIISTAKSHFAIPETVKEFKDITSKYAVFFETEFDGENALSIIDELKPEGIILQGEDEIKVGYKDFDRLGDVLEAIEVLDY